MAKLRPALAAVEPWSAQATEAALKQLASELGIKSAELIHPCRIAISGTSAGPSLYHMLEVLGRDRVLARLRKFNA